MMVEINDFVSMNDNLIKSNLREYDFEQNNSVSKLILEKLEFDDERIALVSNHKCHKVW